MFWLPNFFGAKPKTEKKKPVLAKAKPKKEPVHSPPFWVGTVINQELKDFVKVYALEGKEKEAMDELLDFSFLETCKKLNRRP